MTKKMPVYVVEKFTMDDLSFLLPSEIIWRLDHMYSEIGFSESDERTPIQTDPQENQDTLLTITKQVFLAQSQMKLSDRAARLSKKDRAVLHDLILTAREAATRLQVTQPDTPLGFPKGPQGMISNLLCGTWIDISVEGRLDVNWRKVD